MCVCVCVLFSGLECPFSSHTLTTFLGTDLHAKLMTNDTSGINTKIKVNGQNLETVTSFKYLGSV